jgi:hypothetical protein
MPNDVPDTPRLFTATNHPDPKDETRVFPLESLDDLISEAEQTAAVSVADHVKPCEHPYTADHRKCPTCLWTFCAECESILDPRYCRLCLREADAELRELPLTDTEGHTVEHGRLLIPLPTASFYQPRFGTLAKTISEMSDSELEDYVKQYVELVRQAEKALDFRRVVLGSSQLELTQRKDAAQRKLRSDKTKYPVKTITIDKTTGKQVTKTAGAAALTNMLQMLEALQKLKANKAATAAAKAVDAKMKEPKL